MRVTCDVCKGKKGWMKETPIEERSYSSTSSGEFNGPYWATCDRCYGLGTRTISKTREPYNYEEPGR